MSTISEIKAEKEARFSALIKKVGMFFAFSNEQFTENKTPLKEGEKYVSLGMGGYMPKGNLDQYLNEAKELNDWYKAEIKATKGARRDNIAYELNNHEAYYTRDIQSTLEALGDDYTADEVRRVYLEEIQKEGATSY